MKKLFFFIAWILLGSGLLLAQTAVQPSGSGTTEDPYLIATLENLYWITQNSTQLDKVYLQTENIEASSTITWDDSAGFSPIGNESINFTGSYDGGGKTISNLNINGLYRSYNNYIGLFGCTDKATIQNLGLINVNIIWGNSSVGGLVGLLYYGTVKNCYNARGTVSGVELVGGLVGWKWGGTVENCYNSSSVSAVLFAGGLIGAGRGTVSNCYSLSNVSGTSYVGGLIGEWSGGDTSTVSNCYSTGSVLGDSFVGGLFGAVNGGTMTDSFWDTETSGQSTSAGGTGKTTPEMKTLATFTDTTTVGLTTAWDFEANPYDDIADNNDWDMDLSGTFNSGYPFLSWENGDDVILVTDVNREPLCQLPETTKLLGAFPNPFNPQTQIRYELAKSVQVEIAVYDILGRKVNTLLNTEQNAGHYDIIWCGRNDFGQLVASGAYILRMTAGDLVQSQKVLLMR